MQARNGTGRRAANRGVAGGAERALGPLELATTHYWLCNASIGLAATTLRAGK